jgi:hypothetical protein
MVWRGSDSKAGEGVLRSRWKRKMDERRKVGIEEGSRILE